MEQKRLLWIDILNIIACMGVVLLHSTNGQIHGYSGIHSFDWYLGLLTHSFFLWPVDVFFMISGFTLVRKSLISDELGVKYFYNRRLARLAIPVLSWNFLYMLKYIVQCNYNHLEIGCWEVLIKKFILFEYNGFMWFFIPLFIIYLSLPFFTVFVVNADNKLLRLYLLMGLLLGSLSFSDSSSGSAYIMGTRYFFFIAAGYYIGNFGIPVRYRSLFYWVGCICMVFIGGATMVLFIFAPEHYRYFLSYTNIPCAVSAMAVFTFFRYFDWESLISKLRISSQAVKQISGLSLGIYLIQALWFDFFAHFYPISNLLLRFLIIYVLSMLSVYMMTKIPLVRRMVS